MVWVAMLAHFPKSVRYFEVDIEKAGKSFNEIVDKKEPWRCVQKRPERNKR